MASVPFNEGLQANARKAPAKLSLRRRAAIITGAALLPWLAIGAAFLPTGTPKPAPIAAPVSESTYSLILQSQGEIFELDYNLTISDCFAELHASKSRGPDVLTCQNMGN